MVGTRNQSSGAHSRDPLALPTLQFLHGSADVPNALDGTCSVARTRLTT